MKSSKLNLFVILVIALSFSSAYAGDDKKPGAEYYQIRVYHFTGPEQEKKLDDYLSQAYIPALHKAGIKKVGAFKLIANDTIADKKLYVFFSASSLEKLTELPTQLQKNAEYVKAGKDYMEAVYNQPPFARMENILLKSFRLHPSMTLPGLKNDKKERVYELRSYEGPTEQLYNAKVKMFNEGGEIALFERLGFNAVFYAEVVSGSRMPNLMYMTSFANRADRDAHWKTFGGDPEWKRISALPEYQHTVSKAEVMLLSAAEYSDF
ncbi:MAG: NIPSNAP family protein [Chitinophagaceae bacterium]